MQCPYCGLPFHVDISEIPSLCPRCNNKPYANPSKEELEAPSAVPGGLNYKDWCPECKQKTVIKQNGCEHCEACGWGQCG